MAKKWETCAKPPGVTPKGEGWEPFGVGTTQTLTGLTTRVIWRRRVKVKEPETVTFLTFPWEVKRKP